MLTGMGTDRSAPRDTGTTKPAVATTSSPLSSLQLLLVAVVVAIVAAITVVVVKSLVKLEWQQGRRLAITPAVAVMGAAAIAFGTCVAMILAVGRSAGAGEVVVMSHHLPRATPSCYQPPPPPCRRQQQDGVNDNDDNDEDDN
ncbi:hypothetical protein EDB83DRAFT_2532169 [Lactarius deliciosus]|nr:hypothetical protein EDB83DRAFT_2532169 [Lactarius deliciosus]